MLLTRPLRSELRSGLVGLDHAWASFEHKYIAELIAIEEKARRILVQAIEHESRVHLIEMHCGDSGALRGFPHYCEGQKCLVGCIAHLNSVANVSRKGRDDLCVEVLFDAMATLHRCEAAESDSGTSEHLRAARILATDVVESFEAMRLYLREVEHCLERVDPHLCNNAGLVARLVDWEESWELGTRYMQNEKLLGAVCDLVTEIRKAQRLVPALTAMCDECDVELFMVLPRILLLCFLDRPGQYAELMRSLLPHRSIEMEGISQGRCKPSCWDPQLSAFIDQFAKTTRLLNGMETNREEEARDTTSETAVASRFVWEILLQRVVSGPEKQTAAMDTNRTDLDYTQEARNFLENFALQLEPWSIELQRHCPEDWNQCSAVLVQCLTRGCREQKEVPFRV